MFAELCRPGAELYELREEYARGSSQKRRKAAEWAYDESISAQLFGTAIAHLEGASSFSAQWPPGFAALAIDLQYG